MSDKSTNDVVIALSTIPEFDEWFRSQDASVQEKVGDAIRSVWTKGLQRGRQRRRLVAPASSSTRSVASFLSDRLYGLAEEDGAENVAVEASSTGSRILAALMGTAAQVGEKVGSVIFSPLVYNAVEGTTRVARGLTKGRDLLSWAVLPGISSVTQIPVNPLSSKDSELNYLRFMLYEDGRWVGQANGLYKSWKMSPFGDDKEAAYNVLVDIHRQMRRGLEPMAQAIATVAQLSVSLDSYKDDLIEQQRGALRAFDLLDDFPMSGVTSQGIAMIISGNTGIVFREIEIPRQSIVMPRKGQKLRGSRSPLGQDVTQLRFMADDPRSLRLLGQQVPPVIRDFYRDLANEDEVLERNLGYILLVRDAKRLLGDRSISPDKCAKACEICDKCKAQQLAGGDSGAEALHEYVQDILMKKVKISSAIREASRPRNGTVHHILSEAFRVYAYEHDRVPVRPPPKENFFNSYENRVATFGWMFEPVLGVGGVGEEFQGGEEFGPLPYGFRGMSNAEVDRMNRERSLMRQERRELQEAELRREQILRDAESQERFQQGVRRVAASVAQAVDPIVSYARRVGTTVTNMLTDTSSNTAKDINDFVANSALLFESMNSLQVQRSLRPQADVESRLLDLLSRSKSLDRTFRVRPSSRVAPRLPTIFEIVQSVDSTTESFVVVNDGVYESMTDAKKASLRTKIAQRLLKEFSKPIGGAISAMKKVVVPIFDFVEFERANTVRESFGQQREKVPDKYVSKLPPRIAHLFGRVPEIWVPAVNLLAAKMVAKEAAKLDLASIAEASPPQPRRRSRVAPAAAGAGAPADVALAFRRRAGRARKGSFGGGFSFRAL